MALSKDAAWREVEGFLLAVEGCGRGMPAAFGGAGGGAVGGGDEGRTVAEEARAMRWLLRRLEEQR